jgi:CBS domain-containing protein
MRELNLGSAGVLAHGSLIGIVTERDVMHAALEGAVLAETPVTRYMTKHPETVSIDTDVSKAALAMIALHVRHLPVRDGSRIVGMISARDLLEPLAGKVAPHAPRMRRARWSRLWPRRPRLDARAEWR